VKEIDALTLRLGKKNQKCFAVTYCKKRQMGRLEKNYVQKQTYTEKKTKAKIPFDSKLNFGQQPFKKHCTRIVRRI